MKTATKPVFTRVAARFAAIHRRAETIDKSVVEKWKKDLRAMTKIYRDVPAELAWDASPEDKARLLDRWREAEALFRKFRENFETWAYKVLLPKVDKGTESFLHKIVAETAWTFRHELSGSTLFPVLYSSKEPNLSEFRHTREKNIKRYQVVATKAFKAIEDYIEISNNGSVERRTPVEHFEVGGAQVVIENWGRKDDPELEGHFHKSMNLLHKRIDKIQRAGFPGAVKGLTVTMDFDQKEWDTNGMYRPAEDKLIIFPLGLYGADTGHGTFTHECGHRFYFRELPSQARSHWEETMAARGLKITQDDVHRFTGAVLRGVGTEADAHILGPDERLKAALPAARDAGDVAKFKEMSRLPLQPVSDTGPFRPSAYVDFVMRNMDGEVIQLEEITEYGNTSPMEAFAECFRLWVLQGPGALGPWTRSFFRDVSRAGGAKIARRTYDRRSAD